MTNSKKIFEQAIQKLVKEAITTEAGPVMGDIGLEMGENLLLNDILEALQMDEELRQEMMESMPDASESEAAIFRDALMAIDRAIEEKKKMISVLSKGKTKAGKPVGMNENATLIGQVIESAIQEAIKQVMTEKAPPGMEDVVLSLKKKYGEDSPRPFQIAWAQYNKKHGNKKPKSEALTGPEDFSSVTEVSPPGWKGTTRAMKRHSDKIDNPWALSWWMKKRGEHPHYKNNDKNPPQKKKGEE